MSAAAATPAKLISFDLLYSIRETQLQHGLRSDDFAKYHHYCTGRIKTLRKQLKLSNAHKPVPSKKNKNKDQQQASQQQKSQGTYVAPSQITENNAKDSRAIMLLALMVERCWAESEELRHAATGPADSPLMQRHKGNTTLLMKHSRARLSRATQQTGRLVTVVNAVGDELLQRQAQAYTASIHGRYAFAGGDYQTSKKQFLEARELYHEMVLAAKEGSPSQILATELRTECDDRIINCMRRLNEDATSYKPAVSSRTGAGAGSAFGTLSWLGREIPISNYNIQNALRRFDGLDAFKSASTLMENAATVEDTNGTEGMAWWIFQQQSTFNKLQDTFDRAVGALNDAQDAVSAEMAATSGTGAAAAAAATASSTNELRLMEHCLKFRASMCVAARAYLAAWSLGARFLLSNELLLNNNNGSSNSNNNSRLPSKRLTNLPSSVPAITKELPFNLQHVVSPVDVVKLFDTVLSTIEDALLLPGVDGEDSIEVMKEVIRSDRLFFVARGWQVVATSAAASDDEASSAESLSRCVSSLTHCEKILNNIEKKHPEGGKIATEWNSTFGFVCPVLRGFSRALLVRRAASARTTAAALDAVPELSSMISRASGIVDPNASSTDSSTGGKKKNQQKDISQKLLARIGGGNSSGEGDQQQQQAGSSSRHVASNKLQEFANCSAFTEFPPDFQAAPCKPAFVDIAGTYAEDYLAFDENDDEDTTTTPKPVSSGANNKQQQQKPSTSTSQQDQEQQPKQQQQQQQGGGGWLGWLRGS